ncbi:MAG: S-adenosylmethionine:tRNA ribosyltransferase-isomerase [Candidatus Cryptobacteroides sp.]|nr:S-adenosylmethionine:tRNA ribosyltransferase-isomerase [Candidatus Cryptobacteroides sp.]
MIPDLHIEDYSYPLTDERIAKYPLPERDSSKLLVYQDGAVSDYTFSDIPGLLPKSALMVFNDTRVVPARLHFRRKTGAHIEVFCLEPVEPADYNLSFSSCSECTWKCVIGNAKRWKDGILDLNLPELSLTAELLSRDSRTGTVRFRWDSGIPFSRVLELCGNIPIPPYLGRDTEALDIERYQTLYARIRGSVAAPTAGLHFTDRVLSEIDSKGIERAEVCLHVGAGTFLPVKTSDVREHPMHREPFIVTRALLEKLKNSSLNSRPVVAVGTTSVRTLESLYYAGVSCIEKGVPEDIAQWSPYEREYQYSTAEALDALIAYLDRESLDSLSLGTRIIIVPGFTFRIVDALVTNFHQSESTLILLVSAFVGGDWRTIYDHALGNGYRFLSYGDSSLLFRPDSAQTKAADGHILK